MDLSSDVKDTDKDKDEYKSNNSIVHDLFDEPSSENLIPKHEPTLSYFHLVECLRKCMMRSSENNHHVHDGYGKYMDPSLDVNDMDEDKDEDESNNSIVHDLFDKPSAENLESESECNMSLSLVLVTVTR